MREEIGLGAVPDLTFLIRAALFVGHPTAPPHSCPCAAAAATKCRKIDKLENCAQVNRVKKCAPADITQWRPRDEHLPINLSARAAHSLAMIFPANLWIFDQFD